ncbi:MAG TPA: MFS transporter [Thermaerobacter sp.]
MTDAVAATPPSVGEAAPLPPAASEGHRTVAVRPMGPTAPAGDSTGGVPNPSEAPAPGGPAGPAGGSAAAPSLWRQRAFVVLWLARIVSVAGGMASTIAIQWWVLSSTGSAQWMATVNAVITLVMALVGVPAGVLVDRWHRGRFFLALEVGRGVVMSVLAALLFTGQATLPAVLALLAVDAAGLALFMPLSSALWPELVPPHQLAAANGLVATGESMGRILGPAIGGLLASRHPGWATLADAVSYALSAVAILAAGALAWKAPRRRGQPAKEAREGSFAAQFREGWAAVFGRPDLRPFFLLVSVLNLVFSAAFVLIPVVVREVLHGGPQALGWLHAAFAVGAVTGGLLAGSGRVPRRSRSWVLLVIVQAALGVVLGTSRWLAASVVAGWAFGLVNTLVNVAVTTILQEDVVADLRGRVFGLLFTVAMILQPLGQMAGGVLADRVPLPVIFTATALLTVVVMGVAWWRSPALRVLLDRRRAVSGPANRAPAGEVGA